MDCRVEAGRGATLNTVSGAAVQFHSLPEAGQDALIARAAELAEAPWDARVLPGGDPRFRLVLFDGSCPVVTRGSGWCCSTTVGAWWRSTSTRPSKRSESAASYGHKVLNVIIGVLSWVLSTVTATYEFIMEKLSGE